MRVLAAIACREDPWFPGAVGDERLCGPLLALLRERDFDRIRVFVPSDAADRAPELKEALAPYPVEWDEWPTAWRPADRDEVWALAGDPWSEASLARLGPRGVLRIRVASSPGESPVIEDVEAAKNSFVPHDPRGDYAVNFDQPALRVIGAPEERDARVVARDVGLLGEHPAFWREVERAAAVAPHDVPLLVHGETGTGKGVLARFVHEMSGRRAGPFVAVNCGALPEQLAESLLFGHVRGAFTGAHADQTGKFALADGGTLFLDEIGELPIALQPKLLRVLEDGVVEPVGASRGRKVSARIVAATHRDLRKGIADKTFREDLFFRLSFTTVTLPPLRDRRSDIPLLAASIVARFNRRLARPKKLSPAAVLKLSREEWRGNVRDLENTLGRSLFLSRDDVIEECHLQLDAPPPRSAIETPDPFEGFSMEDYLASVRAELIEKALRKTAGNRSAAARLLGLSPQAVSKYLGPGKKPRTR